MGIRFHCPNGHKLNVKSFQAGRKGICPYCGTKFVIPIQSTRKSSKEERAALRALAAASSTAMNPASQNASPGSAGNMPIAASQTFSPNSSSSPPIIESAKAGDKMSPKPAFFSSQQDAGGNGFALPSLPTTADSITDILNSGPLHDAPAAPTTANPADPLIEAGDVVWYVRPSSGGQYGPATSNMMRQWLAEGRIGHNTLVWREGWRDWRQALDVFQQLRIKDPTADITTADTPYMEQHSSPAGQSTTHRTPKNMLTLTTVLIILTLIILVSLFVWAFTRPTSARDKSGTHSTRGELRDTLSSNHLS
jgi:hypothetical protein